MIDLLKNFMFIQQIDPRIYELEKDIEFYKIIIFGTVLALIILILIVILQRVSLNKLRSKSLKSSDDLKTNGKLENKAKDENNTVSVYSPIVKPKDLPDPGLIFKYSLGKESITDKLITIGQNEGNIKTYSTEVINDHMSAFIRIIDNHRDRDIYDLPDIMIEEYQIDFRRDGKVLVYYPGLDGYRSMGSREKIYIKQKPDETGDPTFSSLEVKQPIRFRIGDRLNQDDKFINGFFEFHLFTQDYEVQTTAGIPKIEKNFLIRLYKIYPGYDVSNISEDGFYPMIDPFSTAG